MYQIKVTKLDRELKHTAFSENWALVIVYSVVCWIEIKHLKNTVYKYIYIYTCMYITSCMVQEVVIIHKPLQPILSI